MICFSPLGPLNSLETKVSKYVNNVLNLADIATLHTRFIFLMRLMFTNCKISHISYSEKYMFAFVLLNSMFLLL